MRTLHVLVIDPAQRLSAEYLFRYSPHKFRLVADVEAAIGAIQSTDYNLIVVPEAVADDRLLQSMVRRQLPEATCVRTTDFDDRSMMRLANQTARAQRVQAVRRLNVVGDTFELPGLRTQ